VSKLDPESSLNRILAAWEEVDCATCLEETVKQEASLFAILRSVSREFGYAPTGDKGDGS